MSDKLKAGYVWASDRDMVFDEAMHREEVRSSRERFLLRLEQMRPLTAEQRTALNREWANYYLLRGGFAERSGSQSEARECYANAIRKAPFRFRAYSRLLRIVL